MIRFAARLAGYVLIAGALALLVIDGTTSIATGALEWTRFGGALAAATPAGYAALRDVVVARIGTSAWQAAETSLFALPAFAVLIVAGLLAIAAGRRPRPQIGFEPLG